MLQLVHQVVRDEGDTTQLALVYANQTEADILLRLELEEIQAQYPNKFKLWYTVDRPQEGVCVCMCVCVCVCVFTVLLTVI